MQPLQLSYSLYFNRQYRHVGHVFQGRYTAILCERDAYLLELVRYLHLNPVRAGIAKRPDAWSWSSHRAYLKGTGSPVPLHMESVLGQFGNQPGKARVAFQDFVREGLTVGHRADLYQTFERQVLGTEPFAEAMLRPRRGEHDLRLRVTIDEILEAVGATWGLDREALRAPVRARGAAQARAAAAHIARELTGHSITAVGRAVERDVGTLSIGVRRLEAARRKDPELARRVASAVAALRSAARPEYRKGKT
jgi:hypothetical protein